mmetsp:Transcript_16182/g.23792  ORF Transcript_16182/g.23792 Transcript_16182/m.23792 type:complete len:280 (-) Transcript_16182:65-904(-)
MKSTTTSQKRLSIVHAKMLIGKRQKTGVFVDDASHRVLLNDALLLVTMSYVDFPTLVRIQRVSAHWKLIACRAIPKRLGNKMFLTNQELRNKIKDYCGKDKVKFADELASTYGWPIGKWNVSKVTSFYWIFAYQRDFNEDIGDWDMSNATTLKYMFFDTRSFNQDLSRWDVSNVTTMEGMFSGAVSFNGDISTWNISKVKTMALMFCEATLFNQNISAWNVSEVRDMSRMFCFARSFNQNISSWNVTNVRSNVANAVQNHHYMFDGVPSFNNDYVPNFK